MANKDINNSNKYGETKADFLNRTYTGRDELYLHRYDENNKLTVVRVLPSSEFRRASGVLKNTLIKRRKQGTYKENVDYFEVFGDFYYNINLLD